MVSGGIPYGTSVKATWKWLQPGFTKFLKGLESGTLDGKSIAMILGGITIYALSGKSMVSSGRAMMACLDNVGKAAKKKGRLTDGGVTSPANKDGKQLYEYLNKGKYQ